MVKIYLSNIWKSVLLSRFQFFIFLISEFYHLRYLLYYIIKIVMTKYQFNVINLLLCACDLSEEAYVTFQSAYIL